MVLFDAAILSLAIDRRSRIPIDFRTGKPIPEARERVDSLINGLERDGEVILIPAPALAEALVTLADKAIELTEHLENRTCFHIKAFGKREAIELAIRTHKAIVAGDKREGVEEPWQKVKYDRQIVATAKTEGATAIYSSDKGVHEHAKLWGIPVLHLADVPLPAVSGPQGELYDEQHEVNEADLAPSAPDAGGAPGPTEGEAGAETTSETKAEGATEGEDKLNLSAELGALSETPADEKPAGDAKSDPRT
jgi:predicted nucleic acid-binding protein